MVRSGLGRAGKIFHFDPAGALLQKIKLAGPSGRSLSTAHAPDSGSVVAYDATGTPAQRIQLGGSKKLRDLAYDQALDTDGRGSELLKRKPFPGERHQRGSRIKALVVVPIAQARPPALALYTDGIPPADFHGHEARVPRSRSPSIPAPRRSAPRCPAGVDHQPEQTLSGRLSEVVTLTLDGSALALHPDLTFRHRLTLSEGPHLYTFSATDGAGHVGTATTRITLDTSPLSRRSRAS